MKFTELILRCKRNKWTTGVGVLYFVIRSAEKQWPAYHPLCDNLAHGCFILLAILAGDASAKPEEKENKN